MSRLESQSESGTDIVNDESHVFTEPFPITLDQRNPVTDSIVVTNSTGTEIYTEGDDYTISVDGDQVQLNVTTMGMIFPNVTDGQVLLVDYLFVVDEESNENSTYQSFRIAQDVTNGFEIFYGHRQLDRDTESSVETSVTDSDFEADNFGLGYKKRNLMLRAEHARTESRQNSVQSNVLFGSNTCLVFCLSVTMFNCGCGSERGELFVELDRPVLWPPPPEKARIKYLGQLSSEADLKKEVSGLEAFGQLVFGRDEIGILISPRGIVLDEQERLFIADASGAVIHMMDLRTRKYRQFSRLGGELKLLCPIDLTIVNNNIYVSDSILGRICVFDFEGNYKFSFGSDMLRRPVGIAYSGKQQKICVADTIRHVIDVFDIEGRLLQEIGGRGSGRGYFNFPTYLWIDKADKLYVSDTLNYRIQVFAPDGEFLLTFGQHGNRPGYFAHPCGLATDSFGNIYVSDKQFENIQIFNSQGQMLMAVGGEGHGPGQFWLPSGIFIDQKNRIFVADSFNKRIQVLQLLEAQEQ